MGQQQTPVDAVATQSQSIVSSHPVDDHLVYEFHVLSGQSLFGGVLSWGIVVDLACDLRWQMGEVDRPHLSVDYDDTGIDSLRSKGLIQP